MYAEDESLNIIENYYLGLGKIITKLVIGGREFKASPYSKYSNKFQMD